MKKQFKNKFEEFMFQQYCYNKYQIWFLINKEKKLKRLLNELKNVENNNVKTKSAIVEKIIEKIKHANIKPFTQFLNEEYEDGEKIYEIIDTECILVDADKTEKLTKYILDNIHNAYHNGYMNGYVFGESGEQEKGNKEEPNDEKVKKGIKKILEMK